MEPMASTLMQMFGDATPIGEYSRQYFEQQYSPLAPLSDRIRNIIDYAVGTQREEKSYEQISPYGGLDITVHSVEDLAITMAMDKDFTEEDLTALRKALRDGGYLKEEIKQYERKYREAYYQLHRLRQEYLKFEARAKELDDLCIHLTEQIAEIDVDIEDQQIKCDGLNDKLTQLTSVRRLFHPIKSSAKKLAAELRETEKTLHSLTQRQAECQNRLKELDAVREEHYFTVPYIRDEDEWHPAYTLRDVEAAEDNARFVLADCKAFYTLYSLAKPQLSESATITALPNSRRS